MTYSSNIVELQRNFLNLNNHKMVVEVEDKYVELPSYKNTPRNEYEYVTQDGYPPFASQAVVKEVVNLPYAMKGLNLVVSREVLRGVNELEIKILKTKDLWKWLKSQDVAFEKKIRFINYDNISKRWPAFNEWLIENIPEEERKDFLKNCKLYVGRKDLWSPGPRIEKNHKVVACKGLIRIEGVGYESL